MSIFSISRLHSMVRGTAGPLCYQLSGRRSGPGGCLYHPAQSSGFAACYTGSSVSARSADQDGILLHHCTGPPGKSTPRFSEDALIIRIQHVSQHLPCILILCLTLSDLDALLAASNWRPLSVVSTSCTLEYLAAPALLLAALSLLGHHLQHPNDF